MSKLRSLDLTYPEIWVNVKGREDYRISSCGRVKSYHRQWRRWVDKELRMDSKGYLTVGISSGTKSTSSARVHRLVAEAFIPNPNGMPFVNHKDNDPTNNDASNLEWCDHQYNMSYSFIKGGRVSGHAKKVGLFIEGKFFSNYSSIEHCTREIATTKRIFKDVNGVATAIDGMFELRNPLEGLPCEEIDRKIFRKSLGGLRGTPVKYSGDYFRSLKELSSHLGISSKYASHIKSRGNEFRGSVIEEISLKEYIKETDLLNWRS